jgi:hypothetical protein
MPSKIGLSYQLPKSESELHSEIGLAPWAGVKSIDYTLPLQVAAAAGVPIRVLRVFGVESADPATAASQFLAKDLSAVTHIQLANESDKCSDYGWQAGVVAGLRAGGYRGAFLGMGFATGNPKAVLFPYQVGYPESHTGPHFPDWVTSPMQNIMSACNTWDLNCAHRSGIALNQYFYSSTNEASWVDDLPFKQNRAQSIDSCLIQHGQILPDVYVTECGREVGGWKSLMTASQFVDAVVFLDTVDRSNSWLKTRFYFTLSPNPQWSAYDYAEVLNELANYVNSERGNAPVAGTSVHSEEVFIGKKVIMAVPIDFKQLPGSYDCWVECIRRFFSRYGLLFDVDTVFQAGKGYAHPVGGEPADFPTFLKAVKTLAASVGVLVDVPAAQQVAGNNYLQYLEIDDFTTLWATLQDSDTADPWTVAVGENNDDLNAGENWQHFGELLQNPTNSDLISWYDPASTWDGDAAQYTKEQFTVAIEQNWDPKIVGYALKIKVK